MKNWRMLANLYVMYGDEIREQIVKDERAKEISEDDKYRLFDQLDKLSRERQEEIKSIGQKKEEEIMII